MKITKLTLGEGSAIITALRAELELRKEDLKKANTEDSIKFRTGLLNNVKSALAKAENPEFGH